MKQGVLTRQARDLASDASVMEHYRQENPWGLATSIDLRGCNPALIRSAQKIQEFVDGLCTLIQMKTFGPTVIVDFGEDPRVAGYSMTQLIETSLISGHFANSSNAAYIDIFSCKVYPPFVAAKFAQEFFEAEEVEMIVNFRY